jgi:hypothetical protein
MKMIGINLIFLENPFRTYNKIKKYFKSLKGFFYFGKSYNVPLFHWNSSYLIWSNDVCWKDKYDTPRFEESPCFLINLFGYTFGYIWKFNEEDEYWEQALWYLYYYNTYSQGLLDSPDIKKAEENWPWVDYENHKSTWNNNYLR